MSADMSRLEADLASLRADVRRMRADTLTLTAVASERLHALEEAQRDQSAALEALGDAIGQFEAVLRMIPSRLLVARTLATAALIALREPAPEVYVSEEAERAARLDLVYRALTQAWRASQGELGGPDVSDALRSEAIAFMQASTRWMGRPVF